MLEKISSNKLYITEEIVYQIGLQIQINRTYLYDYSQKIT
jgi:hypothetical protein